MRHTLTAVATAAVLLSVLAGCGGGGSEARPSGVAGAQPAACSDVLKAGATVTAKFLDEGCAEAPGSIKLGGAFDCEAGPRLYGNDGLFGFEGETFQSGDASSKAYKAAYDECHGNG